MTNFNMIAKTITLATLLSLSACGSELTNTSTAGNGGNNIITPAAVNPVSLNQAAYVAGSVYDFGHNSIPNIPFTGAPDDTDYSRWAMLHDGRDYRFYHQSEL